MYTALTGIILAGGENTRMNHPKPLLEVGGRRIIDLQVAALGELCGEIIVVSHAPEMFEGLGVRVVPDDERFRGVRSPLVGVFTGIKESGGDGFVVACDMPFISPALMSRITDMGAGHDVAIPVVGGLLEPLFGYYSKRSLGALEETLSGGSRRLRDVFARADTVYVGEDELRAHDPGLCSFVNVNTPADLARAEETARAFRLARGHCAAAQKT